MNKNAKPKLSLQDFFQELKVKPERYSLFLFLFLFLFFLPGQNYYQTLSLIPQKPKLNTLPFNSPKPALFPEKTNDVPVPNLSAQGVILMDIDSQVVMYSKNPHQKLLPASTVKIMTAVVSLEHYKPDSILTAWESVSESSSDAALMGLKNGDRIGLKMLLYGLLLNSGADAAETLAQNYPGGKSAFTSQMNRKAKELHLDDTHFVNEIGFDDPGQYTSVLDLASLATYALRNPVFEKIVSTREFRAFDATGKKRYYLKNLNKLLDTVPGANGIKTGYTELAGESLVASSTRNSHRILSVILKSTDRFAETSWLLEWGFANHKWIQY